MKDEMKKRYGVTPNTPEENDWLPEELKEKKKAPEYERKKNTMLCEAFRSWIRSINEREDEVHKDSPRYAAEETEPVTEKMEKHLTPLYEFLGQKEADILTMIIEGDLLFKDQLFGYGDFEGLGIMAWRFSLTPDYFVADEIIEKRKNRAEILRKFANGEM